MGSAVANSSSLMQKAVAAAVAATAMAAVEVRDVRAQTQLPGIVVTTPSPVVRPSQKAQPAAPAAAQVATPAQPPPPTGIIVEDAFVPITVVPSNEITSTPGANLADSLQYRPGITGSNFAPGANRPVIRGLDNFRVRVQENGIGSHDVSALSEDHAVPIDPFSADHIEVVRGPATLRYGSQAIGGVVSAINDRIPEIIPPRGFSVETRGGLNSVDRGADGAFKVTAGAGNFAVHADAFKRHAGDYDTPQGRMVNSFVDNQGFSVGGSLIGPGGFVGVAFTRYDSALRHSGRGRAHRHAAGQVSVARRMARRRAWVSRRSAPGSACPTTSIRRSVGPASRHRLHLHQQGERGPRRGAASARS